MGHHLTGWLTIFLTEIKELLYLEDPQTQEYIKAGVQQDSILCPLFVFIIY